MFSPKNSTVKMSEATSTAGWLLQLNFCVLCMRLFVACHMQHVQKPEPEPEPAHNSPHTHRKPAAHSHQLGHNGGKEKRCLEFACRHFLCPARGQNRTEILFTWEMIKKLWRWKSFFFFPRRLLNEKFRMVLKINYFTSGSPNSRFNK